MSSTLRGFFFQDAPAAVASRYRFVATRADTDGQKAVIYLAEDNAGREVSFHDGLAKLKGDDEFMSAFLSTLKGSNYDAYFFEMPRVTPASKDMQRFEFALVCAPPSLANRSPDMTSFSDYFQLSPTDVAVFSNISGDATLVCPCPPRGRRFGGVLSSYVHVAAFTRNANQDQVQRFWKTVANTALDKLQGCGQEELYLSTAGQGVPWLHFRLCEVPKYYSFAPYKGTTPKPCSLPSFEATSGGRSSLLSSLTSQKYTFEATNASTDRLGAVIYHAMDRGSNLSFKAGLMKLRDDDDFLSGFIKTLTDSEFSAFFFEMPGVSPADKDQQHFEFTLVDAPRSLANRGPDCQSFDRHFQRSGSGVAVFPNLSGDAILVCPCPPGGRRLAGLNNYVHVAAFNRYASPAQVKAFWKTVAGTALDKLQGHGHSKLYLSTAGQGVSWLHFRLCERPKYYTFPLYKGADNMFSMY